ncbi:MAG: ribosome maturation factor RimM [Gemmatimonadota bacterium]
MKRQLPPYLAVGHINKVHGTKGEVFVWPLTEHPDRIFYEGQTFQLAPQEGETRPDPFLGTLVVEGVRPFRQGVLIRFRGVLERMGAQRLQGCYLLLPSGEVEPLDAGEYFYHQLLGLQVKTVAGEDVGRVEEVYELRPAHLLQVNRGEGEPLLVPFLREWVVSVDPEAGELILDPPDGLLEL